MGKFINNLRWNYTELYLQADVNKNTPTIRQQCLTGLPQNIQMKAFEHGVQWSTTKYLACDLWNKILQGKPRNWSIRRGQRFIRGSACLSFATLTKPFRGQHKHSMWRHHVLLPLKQQSWFGVVTMCLIIVHRDPRIEEGRAILVFFAHRIHTI